MPTRNVVLSQSQHEFIESLTQSGRYQNASEVLREGLRLLQERDQTEAIKLEMLKQAVKQGWDDIAAGRYVAVTDAQLEDFIGQLGMRAARDAASSQ